MNTDFFATKRPWSRYKDAILGHYLKDYVPKVASLGKPILIVDCFAGCGEFGDGEPGSPRIICDAVKPWRERGIDISGEFIESDLANFQSLQQVLRPYQAFAAPLHEEFEVRLAELTSRAKTNSIFLYVDPYTVKGLVFDRMKAIYDQIRNADASVECLLNFNVATFMRWALAALTRVEQLPADATDCDIADYQADDPNERVEIATLNGIAGGPYWQSIAGDESLSFPAKLQNFTDQYIRRLRASFKHVCSYPVKEKYEHQTPKYMLIFATRSPKGFELMNDAMCTERRHFVGARFKDPTDPTLFDMTPDAELADPDELKSALVQIVEGAHRITRQRLRRQALSLFFCRFMMSEVNAAISDLLKSGKLFSATGKVRINDSVELSARPIE